MCLMLSCFHLAVAEWSPRLILATTDMPNDAHLNLAHSLGKILCGSVYDGSNELTLEPVLKWLIIERKRGDIKAAIAVVKLEVI